MKKKLLLAVCILAVVIGGVALSVTAAEDTQTAYCQACQAEVTWEPIVYGSIALPEGQTSVHKHYYVPADTTAAKQIIPAAGVTLCIDLNGKSQTFQTGRAFLAYNATADVPCVINLQDSVGGGSVTSYSYKSGVDGYTANTNNGHGGMMWVQSYGTINIYGGSYVLENKTPTDSFASEGGVGCVKPNGTLNIYGGTFTGDVVSTCGGAFNVENGGVLNIQGGTINAGSAPTGSCINVEGNGGKVTLGGDAKVEEIYFHYNTTAQLTVDGAYTGTANIRYNAANVTDLATGLQIGTLANSGSVGEESLYCSNGYTVVADGTALKLGEVLVKKPIYRCEHCNKEVEWDVFTTTAPTTAGTYHYYLDQDYGVSAAKQYSPKNSAAICVDLQGHSYITNGRALYVDGATLSVMDSVGGGVISGNGGNNNPGGGTVSVGSTGTFNLYSGTLTFQHNATTATSWGGTGRGGVIQASGILNIYGGKIIGGEVVECNYTAFDPLNGVGAAVWASKEINILGGEIENGTVPADKFAPGVYVSGASVKVTVGGTAKVEDIYFVAANADTFVVNSDFTGNIGITYAPTVTLYQGMAVGTCAATTWNGTVACTDTNYKTALPSDGKLILSSYPVGTVAGTDGVGYTSLQEAIDTARAGGLVELMQTVSGNVTVNKNLYIQMNGCSIDGTVTVAEGATLYGMDSATVDFTVADGKYGKIQQVVGAYAGASTDGGYSDDSYLAIEETDGVSFHCVRLQVYAMSLRVDGTDDKQEPGLYYKSHFLADEKAAPKLASYGVALSVVDTPRESNLETTCKYTTFTGFESGPYGNLGNASSTLLKGIMKTTNTDAVNKRNMNIQVHGRAYAKTEDGQYLFGKTVYRTLGEQLDGIDNVVGNLSKVQTKAVVKFYNKFKSVLENRTTLENIALAVENDEAGTLKVLLLGNSHGLDATNLLYEVFYQEQLAGNHDQDVVIAALYYGGCRVDQHKKFMSGNLQEYTYHKNDGSQPNRAWVVKDATVLDALRDEQWDVILMQQMNTNAGKESDYKAADWKYVADYLLNNQDVAPKLGFHVTWANPDDYELFLNDDAPYNIRYISTYSDPASWRKNHENLFPDAEGKYEMDVMYDKVMELTQKYLLDSTDFLGRDYFDDQYMMQSATAIHYAYKVCGREQLDLYRDYTHMSDYGRLIIAYQWYAQLMELEEITEVNTDIIPANLRHKNSKYPTLPTVSGDSAVDEGMKEDLIESVNWALKNPWNIPESE